MTRVFFIFMSAAFLFAAPTPSAKAQAYNCARAAIAAEHKICQNSSLGKMDRKMSRLYFGARAKLPAVHRARLKHVQRKWLASRNKCGSKARCISTHYHKWFAEYRKRAAMFAGRKMASGKMAAKMKRKHEMRKRRHHRRMASYSRRRMVHRHHRHARRTARISRAYYIGKRYRKRSSRRIAKARHQSRRSTRRTAKRGGMGRMQAKVSRLYRIARANIAPRYRGRLVAKHAKWVRSKRRCGGRRSCLRAHYSRWFAAYAANAHLFRRRYR